jgi:hypothetical protein
MNASPDNQRMFHGGIKSGALADHLVARFNDRQRRTCIDIKEETALVQIGSKHGTPVTVHISDTIGGVLVTMSRDRNWLDKIADSGEILERASTNPISLIASLPDIVAELSEENLSPAIWNAINDICALTRTLAGENNPPENPIICDYCKTNNDARAVTCSSCGSMLTIPLPRKCPKCMREHTSDALFCQACGTRLIEG